LFFELNNLKFVLSKQTKNILKEIKDYRACVSYHYRGSI